MRSQHLVINADFVLLKRRETETVGRFDRLTRGRLNREWMRPEEFARPTAEIRVNGRFHRAGFALRGSDQSWKGRCFA